MVLKMFQISEHWGFGVSGFEMFNLLRMLSYPTRSGRKRRQALVGVAPRVRFYTKWLLVHIAPLSFILPCLAELTHPRPPALALSSVPGSRGMDLHGSWVRAAGRCSTHSAMSSAGRSLGEQHEGLSASST